jgi:predicted transposase YbfD/YdcC
VLGQQAVDTKSNEITAIPMLLEALDLQGSTITIDAMGCQHKIAHQIVNGGGHYVFGLKGNQGTLHEDVVMWFDKPPKTAHFSVFEDNDKGHGRVETRKITVGTDVAWLHQRHPKWHTFQSMIKLESERWVEGKNHTETRYNMAVVRHVVLNAINVVKPKSTSIKQMRKLAGWSDHILARILSTFI